MELENAHWLLNPEGYYRSPVQEQHYLDNKAVYLFDQQGYSFTHLEMKHCLTNGFEDVLDLHQTGQWTIKLPWFIEKESNNYLHLNHSMLIERKGFADEALSTLTYYANARPKLWKLAMMHPKWGVDISVDYSGPDAVFEVFHFEWDSFSYDETTEMQYRLEEFIEACDFEHMAKALWTKRDEWLHLTYDKMSDYKCDFFGVPRERYKLANWHNNELYRRFSERSI